MTYMPSSGTPRTYRTALTPEKLYSESLLPSRKGIVGCHVSPLMPRSSFATTSLPVRPLVGTAHHPASDVTRCAIGRRIVECITCTTCPARHCPRARIDAVDIHAPASALSFVPPAPRVGSDIEPPPRRQHPFAIAAPNEEASGQQCQ